MKEIYYINMKTWEWVAQAEVAFINFQQLQNSTNENVSLIQDLRLFNNHSYYDESDMHMTMYTRMSTWERYIAHLLIMPNGQTNTLADERLRKHWTVLISRTLFSFVVPHFTMTRHN